MSEDKNSVRLRIDLKYPAPRGGGLGRAGAILAGFLTLSAIASAVLFGGAADKSPPATHR